MAMLYIPSGLNDWVADLLSKEPEECDLFTFYAAPSKGLLLHLSKGALVH